MSSIDSPSREDRSDISVTIVTICKDAGETLAKTINSVLTQTYNNIEYLIIDSASGPETQAVLETCRNKVNSIVSEPDRGISHAFNKGIKRATGQVIGLLNAGDIYLPETVNQAFEALNNSDADFCYGDCVLVESEDYRFVMKGEANYLGRIRYRMPVFNHPTVFVKKEIYEKFGGFDEQWKTAMDYELLRRFVARGAKGVYLPQVMAEMDRHGISITGNRRTILEVRDISIQYGYPCWKAWGYYLFGLFKEYIGQPIRRNFPAGLTRFYRRHFIKNYSD